MKITLIIFFFFTFNSYARDFEKIGKSLVGTDPSVKLSPHQPTYFIFGKDDLKLQFSFKYRLTNAIPLFFGFTNTIFWKIYDKSKPFKDASYQPELYYRLWSNENAAFKILDFGYIHTSNGKDNLDSRSFNKAYLRTSFLTKINRQYLAATLTTHYIYDEDDTNKDITKYYGYWNLSVLVTDVLHIDDNIVDLEFQTFAGDKIVNFNKGGFLFGVHYNFSPQVNTTLYFQRYEGYGEDLLNYNIKHTQYRLGLMLSY